jgi:hypothetical protein
MLTFVIPTHEREERFLLTLKSLKKQINQNFKIIVSNTSKKDYNISFLNDFQNIEYYYNPNRNIFFNYQTILETVASGYYMILEDDDIIYDKNFVDDIYDIIIKNSPDLIITEYLIYNNIDPKKINIEETITEKIDLKVSNFIDHFDTNFQFSQVIFNSKHKPNPDKVFNILNFGYNVNVDEVYLLEILKNNPNLNIYKTNLISILAIVHDNNFSHNNRDLLVYSLILYVKYLLMNYNKDDIRNIISTNFERLGLLRRDLRKITIEVTNIHNMFINDLNILSWEETKRNLLINLKKINYLWN